MADFFPPPPAPGKSEPGPPSPDWMGPPYGVLPGAVALEVVVAQSEQAAVYIGRCAAYATGLDFELHVVAAASAGDLDPSLNGIYQRPGGGSTYETMLRFGVEFADGRKASNLGGFSRADETPEGPVYGGWAAAAGAGAGIRASGCGRCRRAVRFPSSVNGRRPASPSHVSKPTPDRFATPPGARGNSSSTRRPPFRAARGHGASDSHRRAPSRTLIHSAE